MKFIKLVLSASQSIYHNQFGQRIIEEVLVDQTSNWVAGRNE